MHNKIICKFVFACFALFAFVQSVNGAGITISPPKFEFEIDPGGTVVGEIKIVNDEDSVLVLSSKVEDFIAGGETGQPVFVDPSENDASISLGKWVKIQEPEISLEPNSKKKIQFTITVPENAEPGGHYGTIFFAPPSGDGQLSVVQRIGSLVLVRVRGDVKEEGALETFGAYTLSDEIISGLKENGKTQEDYDLKQGIDDHLSSAKFEELVEKSFYETTPIDFRIRYRNTGNVHIKPSGKIEIFNTFGQKLEKIGLKDILNPQGVLTDQEIVDYIPVNQGLGNVLTDSIRMFSAQFGGEAFWYRLDDGTKELRYKGFPVGKYKAKLTLTGVNGKEIKQEISFIIFPWRIIIGYTLLTLLILFALLKIKKWRSKALREKIKKELQKEMKN